MHIIDQGEERVPYWSNLAAAGRGAVISASLMLVLSGCAVTNPVVSSGPYPRVEDCMLLQQATPTKYVCDGKTYTAVQLTDIRKGNPADVKQ
jgi:hypothetical protein